MTFKERERERERERVAKACPRALPCCIGQSVSMRRLPTPAYVVEKVYITSRDSILSTSFAKGEPH